MVVMFFAKIDVIVLSVSSLFRVSGSYLLYIHLVYETTIFRKCAFIWVLIVLLFGFGFSYVLMFYKLNRHFLGREFASYNAMTGNTQSSYLLGHQG